jgi:hypothetical protein
MYKCDALKIYQIKSRARVFRSKTARRQSPSPNPPPTETELDHCPIPHCSAVCRPRATAFLRSAPTRLPLFPLAQRANVARAWPTSRGRRREYRRRASLFFLPFSLSFFFFPIFPSFSFSFPFLPISFSFSFPPFCFSFLFPPSLFSSLFLPPSSVPEHHPDVSRTGRLPPLARAHAPLCSAARAHVRAPRVHHVPHHPPCRPSLARARPSRDAAPPAAAASRRRRSRRRPCAA